MNNVRFKQRAQLLIVGVITLAVSLVFTACPDTAGGRGTGGGTVPTGQTFLVTFGVEGSINGTLKAEIDGTRLFSSPTQVEKGKTVTFTATPSDPSNYNVDYWTITGGTLISGGQAGNTETKIEVTSPVTLTVVFKAVGDPHTTHTVTFAVSGTGGTLNAEADGVSLPTSPAQVNVNAPLVLTAVPQEDCAVDTWTVTGGTLISGGQPGDTETIIRVTSPVTVELRFKAAAYDVYLAGTVKVGEKYKACMWKNDTPMLLNSYDSSQACALAQDTDKEIYIAGYEKWLGSEKPCIWKKDGSPYFINYPDRRGMIYDILIHEGKRYTAEVLYYPVNGAAIVDISSLDHPQITLLHQQDYIPAKALCAQWHDLYAVGWTYSGNIYKTVLWKIAGSAVSERELGTTVSSPWGWFGICAKDSDIYVANKTLWKVSGSTVGTIGGLGGTDSANTVYAAPSALYAAGQKNNKPVIWKIEGNNAAVYKELSTQDGFVVALYAFGAGLFAAGKSEGNLAWWYIAPDLTVTQTVISDFPSGEIRDILVTAQ